MLPSSRSSMFYYLLLPLVILISTSLITQSTQSPTSHFLGNFAKPSKFQKYNYETKFFSQLVDHFSFSDGVSPHKFQQRYLISTEHWSGADRMGPIFMYCGNEGDIEWFAENTGFIWEIAPSFGAMVLYPEHRYYGESMPFGSREESHKNATMLAYLTSEQALADFAVLIRDLKQNYSAEASPVVLFGGSYGGMLAAWMRLKYPHLVIGALSSSAPLLYFDDIVPPETFFDLVSFSFKRESTSCFNTIKESWNIIEFQGQKPNGLADLTKTFHICRKLKNTGEMLDWLQFTYATLAMVNYPYPADLLMPLPGNPVKEVCRRIDSAPNGTSVLERIFEGVSVYYNYTGSSSCFELDDDPHGMMTIKWQGCTELVMPMSSSAKNSMFWTYDYNYSAVEQQCSESFGVKPRPNWITTEFGGHDFDTTFKHYASNIIFSNGLLDPWSGGSVLQNVSDSIVALVTEEGAHHLDLRASTDDDPDWLIQQRESEIKLIRGWIDEYLQNKSPTYNPMNDWITGDMGDKTV